MTKRRGLLIVLSGPSGVGKGTVRAAVFEDESLNYIYSVSATTRKPREDEIDGKDYYFVSKDEFEQLIEGDKLLEYAEYAGNYYGTPLGPIEEQLASGHDVFLEIEVQGAMKVRDKMPDGVFLFLAPPSLRELESRIVGRGTEQQAIIDERLRIAKEELELMAHYDYVIVNDVIELAVKKINAVILAEHLKVSRVMENLKNQIYDID